MSISLVLVPESFRGGCFFGADALPVSPSETKSANASETSWQGHVQTNWSTNLVDLRVQNTLGFPGSLVPTFGEDAFLRGYIRVVDAVNYRIGRAMMYGIFVMIGILLWSSISKTFFLPSLWTLEVAQFAMVAYYLLGGPYSMQLGSNVRMDLFYSNWTARQKAWVDSITVLLLIFYLGILLHGGVGSTAYSLGYWGDEPVSYFAGLAIGSEEIGRLERSPTAWRPFLWPIKTIMCIGIALMLLQATSELCKDILLLRGEDI